jgi:hypothetical protein
MKQNFTKQLVMLAIMFFASMGKAFGYNITTTYSEIYTYVDYEDYSNGRWYWASPYEPRWFDNPVRLHVYPNHFQSYLYRLKTITVDGTDVTEAYNKNDYYEINNEKDHTVNIEFEKYAESKRITVDTKNFTYEVQDGDNTYSKDRAHLEFCYLDNLDEKYWSSNSQNDFLLNSTVRMQVVTEAGWQVTKLLVDGTDVTADYLSNGYYEFTHLDADHKVSVKFAKAVVHTIRVACNSGEYYLNNVWYMETMSFQFNEGSTVVLSIPQARYENDKKYKPTLTITTKGKDPVQVPLNELVLSNFGWYEYTIQNFSENIVAKIGWVEAVQNTITVNSDIYFDFSLNDEWPGVGNPISFDQGSDVTFRLRYIQDGLVLKSIKIGDDDITNTFNGAYTIQNLTEDQVINVTLSPAETTYRLNASFENYALGTIYFKESYTDKTQDSGRRYAKGSDITIFMKPAMGYEVSGIRIEEVDPVTYQRTIKIVNATYNETTKEYEYEIPDFQCEQYLTISTQKKVSAGTAEVIFTLGASGITTFCSEYDLDFSEVSGIRAFVASGYNAETQKLILTEVTEVQRGTGLIIMGTPGTYQIPVKLTSLCYQNFLQAVGEDTQVYYSSWLNGYNSYNYLLRTDAPYFNRANNTSIPAYQAYLSLPCYMTSNAEAISLETKIFGDMNGDGKVNVADNVKLSDIIMKQK